MSTYQGQDKLPKLPIPKLEDTCARYVKALTPLLSEQQLATTRAAVDAFVATDGPKLQQELCAYAEDKASYIEDFWYDAYLAGSSSVVLNINPYFVLEDDPVPQHNDQGRRAAALTISALQFLCKLRAETLAPDDWRGAPLCMNQYRRLFGCTRMPKDGCDQIQSHPDSKHLVVMAKGRIYYFDVLWGDGSLCVSEERLCANLQLILDDARAATSGGGPAGLSQQLAESVGVLTSELRPTWHALRAQLSRDADNAASLDIVDSALFVLCLDDDAPSTPEDVAKTMLHGTYAMRDGVQVGSICNRWYDKMQIIVCANGAAGVNFEHTSVDGHTVLRFVSDVFAATIMRFAAKISSAKIPGADGGGAPTVKLSRGNSARDVQSGAIAIELDANPTPHHVGWRLSPQLEQAVRFAEVRLSDLVHQNETCTLEFDAFGKRGIVAHRLSPDAFVQLAMMAAYYALFGRVVNVYEPVQTKGFLHGRTEAARTMTAEAAHFVRTWSSPLGDDTKVVALRAAVDSLAKLVKLAAAGHGVDRHLYALHAIHKRSAAADAPLPALFADAGWAELNHTTISTSNCGNPVLHLFGFGPVAADGFGVGYIIKDDTISFCASSKHRQTERYLHVLATTLEGIRGSLARVQALQASKQGYDDYFGLGGDEASPMSKEAAKAPSAPLPPRHGRELGKKNVRGGAAPYPLGAASSARLYASGR